MEKLGFDHFWIFDKFWAQQNVWLSLGSQWSGTITVNIRERCEVRWDHRADCERWGREEEEQCLTPWWWLMEWAPLITALISSLRYWWYNWSVEGWGKSGVLWTNRRRRTKQKNSFILFLIHHKPCTLSWGLKCYIEYFKIRQNDIVVPTETFP